MSTDPQHESPTTFRARRVWLPVLVLVLLGFALYLPRLGSSGLWDLHEPRYAQAAREMAERSDWVVPYYRGDPRLNRPPMTYWLIAASHAVLGVNETAARLPSALLAVLGAAALGFAFASRGRPLEGFMAGAALLTAPQWALTGRFATPDMPLASFLGIALALVLFYPAAAGRRARRWVPALLVLLIAAAGLTDWPRGLLLPAWAVLGWGALRWNWRGPAALVGVGAVYHAAQLTHSVPLNYVAIGLAIVLAAVVLHVRAGLPLPALIIGAVMIALLVTPWFVAATVSEPDAIKLYRYKYLFNLGEGAGQHTGPYVYILRMVGIGGMPWSALAVIGLIAGLRRRGDETAGLLAGAFLGAVLFFTLSEGQMGHFYTVVQPTVAGLAGMGAVTLARRLDWSVLPAAAVFVATWSIVWMRPHRLLETATVKSLLFDFDVKLISVVAGFMAAWLLAWVAAKIRGRESWILASVVPAALLAGALGMWMVPALESKKTLKSVWELYLAKREGAEPLGVYGPGVKDSIYYYSNNDVDRLKSSEELREFLSGSDVKFLMGTMPMVSSARRGIRGRWQLYGRSHPTNCLARFRPAPPPPVVPGTAP